MKKPKAGQTDFLSRKRHPLTIGAQDEKSRSLLHDL